MKSDYKLLKPLPGIPEGAIYKYNEIAERYWPQVADAPDLTFTEAFMILNKDWFEKMPERIEIFQDEFDFQTGFFIRKRNGQVFEDKEMDAVREALNGELYSIEQLEELINEYRTHGNIFAFGFIQWLKQRNK